MQLFYNPNVESHQKTIAFDKEESTHIFKVLRKKEGDILHVTNGLGNLFTCKITHSNPQKCVAEILETKTAATPNFHLHIAIAPTKMNERLEWFLEKATEIGINEITPIFCDHSERKIIKQERLEKVLIAAMKQSLHLHLPKLNEGITYSEFIKKPFDGLKLIAHCEESDKKSLKEIAQPQTDTLIIIGPEGDFSTKEIQTALAHQFMPVSLGNTRLRTETAALVACHSVVFINSHN
jgi:16S rRNA (uracil1498-N3)-methyltransferase